MGCFICGWEENQLRASPPAGMQADPPRARGLLVLRQLLEQLCTYSYIHPA